MDALLTYKLMGPIGCSETSVRIYHYTLSNNPEEHGDRMKDLSQANKVIVVVQFKTKDVTM